MSITLPNSKEGKKRKPQFSAMHIPDVQKLVYPFLETEEIIYLRANPPSKYWGGFYNTTLESKDVKYPFKKICKESARKGLLMVLQWARAQGYPWILLIHKQQLLWSS